MQSFFYHNFHQLVFNIWLQCSRFWSGWLWSRLFWYHQLLLRWGFLVLLFSATVRDQPCAILVQHTPLFLLSAFGEGPKGTWHITNPLLTLTHASPLTLKVHFDPPGMDGYFMAKLRQLKACQCSSLQDFLRKSMRPLWPFHFIFFSCSSSSHACSNFLVKNQSTF